jgi:glycosyltransferase involved in cell wall biosynthesis
MKASVIICTHNPKRDLLARVLDALRAQTLPLRDWELLLLDNASEQSLAQCVDLTWHPHGRVVREDELGLTSARLRGIRESRSDLLVFVDDDNLLDADYVERAVDLAPRWPNLGVFGGNCRGEFPTPPSPAVKPYLSSLAVSEVDRELWSNAYEWSPAVPLGAGMILHRRVAETYARRVEQAPLLRKTGRRGTVLTAGEDNDIVWTAIDVGLGYGRFPTLRLTHVIPPGRLTEAYMIRLHAGFSFSEVLLHAQRAAPGSRRPPSWKYETKRLILALLRGQSLQRRIEVAQWRARRAAHAFLRNADQSALQSIDGGRIR